MQADAALLASTGSHIDVMFTRLLVCQLSNVASCGWWRCCTCAGTMHCWLHAAACGGRIWVAALRACADEGIRERPCHVLRVWWWRSWRHVLGGGEPYVWRTRRPRLCETCCNAMRSHRQPAPVSNVLRCHACSQAALVGARNEESLAAGEQPDLEEEGLTDPRLIQDRSGNLPFSIALQVGGWGDTRPIR